MNSDFKQLCKTGITESPEHLRKMGDALTGFDNAVNSYKAVHREYASDLCGPFGVSNTTSSAAEELERY